MRLLLIGFIGCFATITAAFAIASEDLVAPTEASADGAGSAPAEPPSGRVGRISLVSADVSVGTANGWVDAVVNRPLSAGNALRTGPQAPAEIDFGTGAIDLSHDTELKISQLDDQIVDVSVDKGRIGLVLRQLDSAEKVEIEVSGQAVQLVQPGRYDIDAATRRVAVLTGRASLDG